MSESSCMQDDEETRALRNDALFSRLGFSFSDNGTFSPPMDVTNQIQNGTLQHASVNSNYSSGSGDDSPGSLSPGKTLASTERDGAECFATPSSSNVIRWTIRWQRWEFQFID